jgi:hypothetical protein
VLSIAGILQVLHKTDVEEKYGNGTTVERLKITQRSAFYRAGNLVSGPEISPQGRNFCPWTKFPGARNSTNFCPFEIRLSPLLGVVVQRSVKGPKILVWAEFPGPEIP